MVRAIDIEGVIAELPESGFSNGVPPLQNEKILGLTGLFAIFLLTINWGAIFASLPLNLISIDIWTGIGVFLVLVLRFGTLLFRDPVGGTLRGGFFGEAGKSALFWDTAGELALTFLLCLLVVLKNPLVFVFILVLVYGRFKAGRYRGEGDFERWYQYTAY